MPEGETKGRKFDENKLRWDLLPIEQLEKVVAAYTHGSKIYGDDNWKFVDRFKQRYYSAAMRHLADWKKGIRYDKNSGLECLAQAAWNLFTLMWKDDQPNIIEPPEGIVNAARKVRKANSLIVKSKIRSSVSPTKKTSKKKKMKKKSKVAAVKRKSALRKTSKQVRRG